ncbi:SPX domain-containing protein 4 [Ricinus communis]|uniref:Xenotropic and polytropic murine leukemia virus receptor ids-4, putative n=1 Tax=Ricinus communis TaxID=3988 RepID=B9SVI2_RICCO|nr:SPX domain-containing protein 4 [Ricinus communis]EEF32363.1 xenotropic and polytropic murine leukemia virus receptor ids-4, putative [Ricinus communis]|eukprot:XP_002530001.1 SPX domain-containing protein 4 [Ricinus communis]
MKFGKEFKTHLEETLPEWRDKFLCYKPLKKLLKQFPATSAASLSFDPSFLLQHQQLFPIDGIDGLDGDHHNPETGANRSLLLLQDWFIRILNEELDKFNDFYVDKEEEFIIRFQELKERIECLKEQSSMNGVFTSESEFSEEMMDIRKDLVTIHGEMVLLKNYSSLNFAGLVKILKKYDKRTGELLCLPFTQLALHQPFFTTEPLTRLVHECEANLELLFPLQAEVIESNNSTEKQSNPPLNNSVNMASEGSSALGDDTIDIYRSTLAAMKAIRGLQKASSTYNPLSFSSLFKNQDDENNGAVTAENSASNSLSTLHHGEESDKDDVHSV